MIKDTNSEQRAQYSAKIAEKEQGLEELQIEQREVLQELEAFETLMRQNFKKLEAIEDERNKMSEHPSSFSETEHKKRYMLQLLAKHEAELLEAYDAEKRTFEDEREALQKERDALAWD